MTAISNVNANANAIVIVIVSVSGEASSGPSWTFDSVHHVDREMLTNVEEVWVSNRQTFHYARSSNVSSPPHGAL